MTKIIDLRNLVLIVVVLTAVVIFGYWMPYLLSRGAEAPDTTIGNAEVTVEYTKKGFEPETLTVPVGTTVAWKNTSGRPMWVGSDPHPSHTDLEGFDQKRIINQAMPRFVEVVYAHGEGIYEYTFTKTGSWGYHNHVYPEDRGTVIVVEKEE